MTKTANELIFISQIKRDGNGTIDVPKAYQESMYKNNDKFEIRCLSMTERTYIAHGFNSFVVKLKEL